MHRLVRFALALVVAASPLAVARPIGQQAPTFKAGVELVLIDVTVVDKDGRPVRDLKPSEFSVSIDGKPRTISSVHYQDFAAAGEEVTASAPADRQWTPGAPPQGRSVLIAVDTDSMEPDVGLEFKRAAHRFIDTLGPNDRVGVVTIPRLQSEVPLSTDRDAARKVIDGVVTGVNVDRYEFDIGTAEALDLERGNSQLFNEVSARECRKFPGDGNCPMRVQMQVRQMQIQIHLRGQRALDALFDLADSLSAIQGPKTMLLVSGGMPMPDARSTAAFSRVAEMFAAGQVSLYTLFMERSTFGQVRNAPSPSATFDDLVERDGLENVTSVTGGTFMLGIGTVDQYFKRVLTELTGSYLLGVEVAQTEKDGKPHRVEVRSARAGLQIRARKRYVIGTAPAVALKIDGGSLGATAVERVLTAARDLETGGEIGVRAKAQYSRRAGGGQVVVKAAIDPRSLYLVMMGGRRVGRLAIGTFVGHGKRAAADAVLWQDMRLELSDDSYRRFKVNGIPYTTTIPATETPRYVKVVVYEYRSGGVGAATAKVR